MIHDLSVSNSLLNNFVVEIRDEAIQKDSMRFRNNMERIGQIIAYEISKHLSYEQQDVVTPLGVANAAVLTNEVVLMTILRAGLPMHQGMLSYLDKAENAFISAYRSHHKDGTFEIKLEYVTCPNLEGKTLILSDPMIATGASVEATLEAIEDFGTPAEIHVATVISSKQGLEYIERLHQKIHIWTAAIDEELTAKSYIVPGLGDAGDLSYGSKLQD